MERDTKGKYVDGHSPSFIPQEGHGLNHKPTNTNPPNQLDGSLQETGEHNTCFVEGSKVLKLTAARVWTMRYDTDFTMSDKQLANFLHLSPNTIRNARIGRSWKHIKEDYYG